MSTSIFELVIGDKAWSSWSLRPWLAMVRVGMDFTEVPVRLRQPDTAAQIAAHSPSGLVPVLKWNGAQIADSYAILETVADLHPAANLLPPDPYTRAVCRSACAQMHSGYGALRRDMPMDLAQDHPGDGHSGEALADAAKVVALWTTLRRNFGKRAPADEGFLFGHFTLADAMFAPVATRFATYHVDLAAAGDDGTAAAYRDHVLAIPEMQRWREEAKAEMAAR